MLLHFKCSSFYIYQMFLLHISDVSFAYIRCFFYVYRLFLSSISVAFFSMPAIFLFVPIIISQMIFTPFLFKLAQPGQKIFCQTGGILEQIILPDEPGIRIL